MHNIRGSPSGRAVCECRLRGDFYLNLYLPSPAAYAATSPKGRGFALTLEHYIYSIRTVQNNKMNSLVDFSIPIV